jgi:hypothetical protein
MEDDTCVSELDFEVAASMARCGIPTDFRARSILTAQSISGDETFQTQSSRVSMVSGSVLSLQPSYNEGIYRAIPAMSRINAFVVTMLVPPTVPYASNSTAKLDILLVKNPYATTVIAGESTAFLCVAIADGDVNTATQAAIPLKQSSAGSFNRMIEPGLMTTLTVLVPTIGGLPAPLVLTEPLFPALLFTGTPAFPPETQIILTVSYDVSRVI